MTYISDVQSAEKLLFQSEVSHVYDRRINNILSGEFFFQGSCTSRHSNSMPAIRKRHFDFTLHPDHTSLIPQIPSVSPLFFRP